MYQDLILPPGSSERVRVFVTIGRSHCQPANLSANSNPIAADSHVNIDASQLRGTFGFQVSEPDYTYELLPTV
jgi:hypothetical protein